jgi:hypothetical protein
MQLNIPFRLPFRPTLPPLLAMAVAALCGCTPLSEKEKEYLERRQEEREEQESFSQRMQSSEQINAVIQKVKAHPVEGGTAAENWINLKMQQLRDRKVEIIYQKWTSSQKTTDRHEVRFLYTVLGDNYEPEKHGYLWEVDNTLDQVTGPLELSSAELEPAYKKRGQSQAEIKRRQNRWSLE